MMEGVLVDLSESMISAILFDFFFETFMKAHWSRLYAGISACFLYLEHSLGPCLLCNNACRMPHILSGGFFLLIKKLIYPPIHTVRFLRIHEIRS